MMFKKKDFIALNSLQEVQQMSWRDFEWFCKFLLESIGYDSVSVTSSKYDGGVDNIAFKNGEKVFVQDKHWSKYGSRKKRYVPVEIVRALAGSMQQKSVKKGIVIATVPVFEQAKREARKLNIEIIDLEKLKLLLKSIKPNFDVTETQPTPRKKVLKYLITHKELVRFQWVISILFASFVYLLIRIYN